MTDKDYEIQRLKLKIAEREERIDMLMRLVDALCVRHHICEICTHVDDDGCVPEYITCSPVWNKQFRPKS